MFKYTFDDHVLRHLYCISDYCTRMTYIELPEHWDENADENSIVPLKAGTKEYQDVEQNFSKTLGSAPNLQILEVNQNIIKYSSHFELSVMRSVLTTIWCVQSVNNLK